MVHKNLTYGDNNFNSFNFKDYLRINSPDFVQKQYRESSDTESYHIL